MTTTTLPTITHRIAYDRTTRDFACYVQIEGDPEQYIGSADSYHEGETRCLDYRRDLLESDVFRTATELDGTCGDCTATLDSMGLCGCRANTDETALDLAWRAHKAGALEWSDVQAIQAQPMPRCAAHDTPTAGKWSGRPVCPQCMEEGLPRQFGSLV